MKFQASTILVWTLRLTAAIIMLQTLFFKFTAAPESVYIFSQLGLEPHGRIGIGVLELIASFLILVPRTTIYGAILAFGLMAGAIFSHVVQLGYIVQDDGGLLFSLAVIVLIVSAILIGIHRREIPFYHTVFPRQYA